MNVAEKTVSINVAQEFSKTPGPRFRSEGNFSGEQFREEILEPKFLSATAENARMFVDLDGGYGYATSFLEEAFGGLARIHGEDRLLRILDLKSDEEPYLIDDIKRYIRGERD
jgi:hypothetical protein